MHVRGGDDGDRCGVFEHEVHPGHRSAGSIGTVGRAGLEHRQHRHDRLRAPPEQQRHALAGPAPPAPADGPTGSRSRRVRRRSANDPRTGSPPPPARGPPVRRTVSNRHPGGRLAPATQRDWPLIELVMLGVVQEIERQQSPGRGSALIASLVCPVIASAPPEPIGQPNPIGCGKHISGEFDLPVRIARHCAGRDSSGSSPLRHRGRFTGRELRVCQCTGRCDVGHAGSPNRGCQFGCIAAEMPGPDICVAMHHRPRPPDIPVLPALRRHCSRLPENVQRPPGRSRCGIYGG